MGPWGPHEAMGPMIVLRTVAFPHATLSMRSMLQTQKEFGRCVRWRGRVRIYAANSERIWSMRSMARPSASNMVFAFW